MSFVSDFSNGSFIFHILFQKKTYPSAQVGQVNPPKFEKCDDMVNLTYLNDASVFHNLEGRYKAKLIHTCKYLYAWHKKY